MTREEIEQAAKRMALEGHCRYCDRLSEPVHPANKCSMDVEIDAHEIAEFVIQIHDKALEEAITVASPYGGTGVPDSIRALKIGEK